MPCVQDLDLIHRELASQGYPEAPIKIAAVDSTGTILIYDVQTFEIPLASSMLE